MSALRNTWTKRAAVTLECPSGSVCLARRPGPELALRIARLQRSLTPLINAAQAGDGVSLAETRERTLGSMDDETARAAITVARETVASAVVEPKLYLDPDPEDESQIGVDDIDTLDFWHIFGWAMHGARSVPVKLKGGETTTVEAVENFPESEGRGAGLGDHGGDVPESKPESKAGARRRRAAGR